MDHGYFHDRISAWLDGELPPYEAQVVGEHLETCEECQALLARLKQVDDLVDKHSQLDGDDDYWETMAQKIEAKIGLEEEEVVTDIRPKQRSGLFWKIAAAAASIAVLAFVGLHQDDIFKQKDHESTAGAAMRVDTASPQEWLRNDSAEVAHAEQSATGHEPAEPTIEEQEGQAPVNQFADKESEQAPAVPTTPPPPAPKKTAPTETRSEAATTESDQAVAANEVSPTPQRVAPPPTAAAEQPAETLDEQLRMPGPIVIDTDHKDLGKTIKVKGDETKLRQYADSVARLKDNAAKPKDTLPRTVDELLQDVKGVVTNTSGETFRRGDSLSRLGNLSLDRDSRSDLGATASELAPMRAETPALDLQGWIKRRDSLETLWADLESQHGKLSIPKGRKEGALSDEGLIERELLEAYYNVALLAGSDHQEAFDRSVDSLRAYTKRPDVRYREIAQGYLDRLVPDSLEQR